MEKFNSKSIMSLQWQLFRIIMVLSQWMGLNLSTMLQTTEGFKEFYIHIYTKSLVVHTYPKKEIQCPKIVEVGLKQMYDSFQESKWIYLNYTGFFSLSVPCLWFSLSRFWVSVYNVEILLVTSIPLWMLRTREEPLTRVFSWSLRTINRSDQTHCCMSHTFCCQRILYWKPTNWTCRLFS